MPAKLEIVKVSKDIAGKQILNEISFTVNPGEFLSILGPSGCGKTTLLRILIGLTPPTSGQIYKSGVDITGLEPSKRGMGIVFQNYALFQNMTVLGNVEYALRINKDLKKDARQKAEDIIELMGLSPHINKKPHKLSGGQQQRTAIARTLALNPDIILFDEPMSALDVETRLALRSEIKRIQKCFGSTMLYITHDQEEAFSMSDRVLVMDTSIVKQIGTPEEIIKHPCDEYVERFVLHNLRIKIDSLKRFVEL